MFGSSMDSPRRAVNHRDSFTVKVPVEKRLKVPQCRSEKLIYLANQSGKTIFVGDNIDVII
jgi:hypothetical protein|tara:strand:+ start:1197 stop:1379 length:183 start_codon:yes stop_codon:yes gene_type:complete